MVKTLTATLECKLNWQYLNDENISVPSDKDQNRNKSEMASGSGASQLEIMFRDRVTVTPSTPNHDIDLAGVIEDVFGDVLTYTEVLAVLINNLNTASGDFLLVGAAAVFPWTAPFDGSATAKILCGTSSPLVFADVIDGLAVVPGSSDVLRIAHNGVSVNDIVADIVIVGHET